MSTFPTSLDNLSTSHADGTAEVIHASTINDLASAVNAIETTTQPVVNGASANVTGANLSELTGGTATSLHSHTGGGGAVQSLTTHIDSAHLLDLHNTPVSLVPTPGPGKVIWPSGFVARYTAGGLAYTVPGGTQIFIGPAFDPVIQSFLSHDVGDLASSADAVLGSFLPYDQDYALSAVADTALVAQLNAAHAVTGGNGTLDVTVYYVVVG